MYKDKYLSKLVRRNILRGGCVLLNKETQGKVIERPTKMEFRNLYPNLLIYLYKNDIFNKLYGIKINVETINRIEAYLNRFTWDQTKTFIEKSWVNSIWINEFKDHTPIIFDLFDQYMEQFYIDVIAYSNTKWYYVDTDKIYLDNKIKTDWFPDCLRYNTLIGKEYAYIIFHSVGKLILYNSKTDFKTPGFSTLSRNNSLTIAECMLMIKNYIKQKNRNNLNI